MLITEDSPDKKSNFVKVQDESEMLTEMVDEGGRGLTNGTVYVGAKVASIGEVASKSFKIASKMKQPLFIKKPSLNQKDGHLGDVLEVWRQTLTSEEIQDSANKSQHSNIFKPTTIYQTEEQTIIGENVEVVKSILTKLVDYQNAESTCQSFELKWSTEEVHSMTNMFKTMIQEDLRKKNKLKQCRQVTALEA